MASTGIGQRFPKPAITLIIAQGLAFYSVFFNMILGDSFKFKNILSIALYIFFAITILARKRKVGMLISTICLALFTLSNSNASGDFLGTLYSLHTAISMLCLVEIALANLGTPIFEKLLGVARVVFKICFFVNLFTLVFGFLTNLGFLVDSLDYDFEYAIFYVFNYVINILITVAMYKIGLWMADIQYTKPVRKNAYIFDEEPLYFKRNFR